MNRSTHEIYNYVLDATDGEIGRCKDFLVDDRHWTIRYMVADTRKWLPGRKVLISPFSIQAFDWKTRRVKVNLSRGKIENAPDIDVDAPVSRRQEIKMNHYYGYPPYWIGNGVWGVGDYPAAVLLTKNIMDVEEAEESTGSGDPHLRSLEELRGYHISATDGEIGHIHDFILDDEAWVIRYVVLSTRNWLPGHKVRILPFWANAILWGEKKMRVQLTREDIKNSPTYDHRKPVHPEYEKQLDHYYNGR